MANKHSPQDQVTAPDSYDQLFDEWFEYIKALMVKQGIRTPDDAAMSIIETLIKNDYLGKFDPEYTAEYGGQVKRTRFGGYLSGIAVKYSLNLRDRQAVKDRKEPKHCEDPVCNAEGETSTWLEVFGEDVTADIDTSYIDYEQTLEKIFAHLRSLPIRGGRDMPRLFQMCLDHMFEHGKIVRSELAESFGISPTAVHLYMVDLRTAVADAIGQPERAARP